MNFLLVYLWFTLGTSVGAVASPVDLTESLIIDLSQKNSVNSSLYKAQLHQSQAQSAAVRQSYELQGFVTQSYSDTNEESLNDSNPQLGPIKNLSLGLKKALPVGVAISVSGFSTQMSAVDGTFSNATRVGALVQLELDIWKNFLGRLDRSKLRSAKYKEEYALLLQKLNQSAFELEMRKLYWSLVANEQALELARKMVGTAQVQLRDIRNRRSAGDADRGDLARSEAQLANRESAVSLLEFKKEQSIFQLKKLLPGLADNEVNVVYPNFNSVIQNILICVTNISQTSYSDMSVYSPLQAMLTLVEQTFVYDQKISAATDSMDLKLSLQHQSSAVADNHSDAYNEFQDLDRNGQAIGVSLSIPLGGASSDARKHSVAAVKYSYESEKKRIAQELKENHNQIIRSLKILEKAVAAQTTSVGSLDASLTSALQKYRQARTTINAIVLEQDSLFNSSIQEIDTKLAVVNTLYDFFKIYTDYPCKTNQSNTEPVAAVTTNTQEQK